MLKINDFDNFVFDLDGTLLNKKSELSEHTIKVIQKLKKLNKNVIIATGRSGHFIYNLLEPLKISTPLITINGQLLLKENKIDVLHASKFNPFTCDLLTKFFEENKIYSFVYTTDAVYLVNPINNKYYDQTHLHAERKKNDFIRHKHAKAIFEIKKSYSEISNENILKFEIPTSFVSSSILEKLQRFIDMNATDLLHFFSSASYYEIQLQNFSKATGLEKICQIYNFDKSKTIAFGDETNDIEMAKNVKFFVAMKNGNPKLKAIANDISQFSNDEDGVAKYIEEHFEI
ncbi:hypothetical protein CJJ23_00425 [Mycoplasmopsis agassizii]|uniref:Haloacid dehalogenase n=1 Tax=Mycoplasmopsis agassizii TaxID=33922 RepID=A0A269TKB5_9BACT|nr:HAD family hydrolase [Mycoplasmopsis agassizii]PAK21797.1 hypothetical protein CJJ23_00425 [Mycoplasmopsis agassizii]